MNQEAAIQAATEQFAELIRSEFARIERMKQDKEVKDFSKLDKIIVGIMPGDGIGPIIMEQAIRVLKCLMKDEIASGKLELRHIEGMTIENRAAKNNSLPDECLAEIKKCDVLLKGPMVTPRAGECFPDGSPMPNLVSANSLLRRSLELFSAVRPIRIPEKGIDWTFFRENTEGAYAVGSKGVNVNDDLAMDFVVTTTEGTERIARLAYEYAKNNNKDRVSIIQKANVIKTTDGKFLNLCKKIGEEYPEITTDEWYIDITTAKLIDEKRRRDFKVFVLPNLYGDIITDEAAQFQGGVGTAGSANIGKHYAMFEAIHGSAPRMVNEGRGKYADPCSMLRATVMLLDHIGRNDKARALERALDKCMFEEKKYVVTGHEDGATCREFGDYVMETIQSLND